MGKFCITCKVVSACSIRRQPWGHLTNLSEFNRNREKSSFSQPLWLVWVGLKQIIFSACNTVFLYFIHAWSGKIRRQKIIPHDSQVTSGNNLENTCNIPTRKRRCDEEYLSSVNSHEVGTTHPYGNAELAALCIYILHWERKRSRKIICSIT